MATGPKVIEFPIEEAFIKIYKLRFARRGADTVEISVPRDFIRRMARKSSMTMREYVNQCQAVVYFGMRDELLYRFEIANGDGAGSKKD